MGNGVWEEELQYPYLRIGRHRNTITTPHTLHTAEMQHSRTAPPGSRQPTPPDTIHCQVKQLYAYTRPTGQHCKVETLDNSGLQLVNQVTL